MICSLQNLKYRHTLYSLTNKLSPTGRVSLSSRSIQRDLQLEYEEISSSSNDLSWSMYPPCLSSIMAVSRNDFVCVSFSINAKFSDLKRVWYFWKLARNGCTSGNTDNESFTFLFHFMTADTLIKTGSSRCLSLDELTLNNCRKTVCQALLLV